LIIDSTKDETFHASVLASIKHSTLVARKTPSTQRLELDYAKQQYAFTVLF
jgi:hypothetical protein